MVAGWRRAAVLVPLRVVGAAGARRRVARHALAAARERRLARPQHRRGARGAAGRRLRVSARGRSAGRQGAAAVRPRGLDDRRASSRGARSCTSCSTRPRGCASGRWSGACCWCWRRTCWCSGRSRPTRRRAGSRSGSWSSSRRRGRRGADRVRRAELGARRRGGAGGRGAAARGRDGAARRALALGRALGRTALPAREIRFRDVTFAYPGSERPVLEGFDLTIPAGSSLAIVGQNGAGKTTLAKLLCRLYDPQAGAIEIDGVDLRELDLDVVALAAHGGVPGLHPLRAAAARQRGARGRARRRDPRGARRRRAPTELAELDTVARARLRRAAPISRAASGSAWRWRARCAPCGSAPGSCCSTSRRRSSTCAAKPRSSSACSQRHAPRTTILISHRFSTVRHADRICVLEHGRGRRARHARRADGARRPLPDDVRPAGAALHGRHGRGRRRRMTSSPEPLPPALAVDVAGAASSATATSRG